MEKDLLKDFIEKNSPLYMGEFFSGLSLGLEEETIKQEIFKRVEGKSEQKIFDYFFDTNDLVAEYTFTMKNIEIIDTFHKAYFA